MTEAAAHRYVVIRAGGGGTRLWPLSTSDKPKQFHAVLGQQTMLQDAYQHARRLVDADRIFVSTSQAHVDLVREQLPECGDDQIISEPARRDTAPAIGLELQWILNRDPEAVICSLGSDHHVLNAKQLQKLLKIASDYAYQNPETLVTLGVVPTYPETGFGYISRGDSLECIESEEVFAVKAFKEKPDQKGAEVLVASGALWNANMFVWKAQTLWTLYEKLQPDMAEQLKQIGAQIGQTDYEETLARHYPELDRLPVDTAILEKAPRFACLAADIGWSDVGHFQTLYNLGKGDENSNVIWGRADFKDATKNLVHNLVEGHQVALLGVDDLCVVHTAKGTLVCPIDRAQDLKALVQSMKSSP